MKGRYVKCDICGKRIWMSANAKVPVHVTSMGSMYVHPAHALRGFPLPVPPKPLTLEERFEAGYVPVGILTGEGEGEG